MKAQVFKDQFWIKETDPATLYFALRMLLKKAGLTPLQFVQHNFKPQGFTALWLLEESHLAVHTWPEEQCSYIDLTSCNKGKSAIFMEHLTLFLTPIKK